MGKTTEYLGLYEPYDSDFYDVDRDQNENFTILDNKAKEVDEAILSVEGYTDGLATSKTINSFPLSQATEGEVYKVPNTNKYVVCIKNYSGSLISLPNSNFEELSVWKNKNELLNNEWVEILNEQNGNIVLYYNKFTQQVTIKFYKEVSEGDFFEFGLERKYFPRGVGELVFRCAYTVKGVSGVFADIFVNFTGSKIQLTVRNSSAPSIIIGGETTYLI